MQHHSFLVSYDNVYAPTDTYVHTVCLCFMQHVFFALLVPQCMGCPKTGVNALQVQKQPMQPVVPIANYATVSLSNVIATSCQYEALKHVSFPVQTLSKCAKMIPVMIWGALIARKTYSIKQCCVAALVTVGCTCFLLSGSTTSKNANDSSLNGFVLMLTYLAFDGFTTTFQVFCYHSSTSLHLCSWILPLPEAPFKRCKWNSKDER